jgi:hypothetical protein
MVILKTRGHFRVRALLAPDDDAHDLGPALQFVQPAGQPKQGPDRVPWLHVEGAVDRAEAQPFRDESTKKVGLRRKVVEE